METTDTQDFSTPEPEDYPTALQLKLLADQVDTDLFAMQTALTAQLKPKSIILTLNADITGVPNNFSQPLLGVGSFTSTYNNGFPSLTFGQPPESGSYLIGACLNAVCAGTINANTIRRVEVVVPVPAGAAFGSATNFLITQSANENSNTLGTYLSAMSVISFTNIPTNPPGVWPVYFFHMNTSSTMTIKAGSFLWASKVADPQ